MNKCPKCLTLTEEPVEVCKKCGFSSDNENAFNLAFRGIDENEVTRILADKAMTPEKWKKIKDLFESAETLPEDERGQFLDRECTDDPDVKAEVEKLLDAFDEEDDFLEESAVAEVASMFEERPDPESGERDNDTGRFEAGSVLDGRYKVLNLLGKGGMGEVYLANDTKLDRKVALKVLPTDLTESKKRLQRFEQEARAVSALNHPHILTIFEFGKSADGVHFIASEYVEGKTLLEHEHYRDLTLNRILDIALQITSALAAAHEAGITHRDIKPDNIMVRNDGYIKILDFGLAKLTENEQAGDADSEATTKALVNTAPGSVMGTAAYMSPEQARGLAVDARTDIWSVGVILYELITGQRPFKGDTSTDTIISVIKKEPRPIGSLVEDFPSEIEWVVSKTLSKERDGRYQTAKELNADLKKIKKRVEFNEEIERTGSPSRLERDDSLESTINRLEDNRTEIGTDKDTNELTSGLSGIEVSHPESSLEYAVTKAAGNKGLTAIIAIVIVAAISAILYFAFIGNSATDNIDSIAVLPFVNGSKDEKLIYLSDGISESLIDRLSQLPQLKVIARNSSFRFRGDNIDVQDVANQLGVRAIIMGRVVQVGDSLTIRVEVIDAAENKQLWGQTYNRQATDVLSIQNEIAGNVSEELSLELTSDQEKRMTNGGTDNPEAYRYYLDGLVALRGPTDVRSNALDHFLQAVKIDPNFAQAHTEISMIYSDRSLGSSNPGELMPKAKESAEKALELDDNLAMAHVALAAVKEYQFDWKGAEEQYKKAIDRNPNLDEARNRYGFFLSVMGRHTEALMQNEQAELRDPINKRLHLQFKGMNLIQARKFDEAITIIKEANNIESPGNILDFDFGYAYLGKGMYKEAADAFRKSVDNFGGDSKYSQALVYMAAAYAKIPEKRADAGAIAKRLETTDEYVSPALLAIIYSALGEKEKGINALEKAYQERDLLLRYIGVGYEYDGLRNDPRFKELLKKTGLNSEY